MHCSYNNNYRWCARSHYGTFLFLLLLSQKQLHFEQLKLYYYDCVVVDSDGKKRFRDRFLANDRGRYTATVQWRCNRSRFRDVLVVGK